MSNPDGKKAYLDYGCLSDWKDWVWNRPKSNYRRFMRRYWSRKIRAQGKRAIQEQEQEGSSLKEQTIGEKNPWSAK